MLSRSGGHNICCMRGTARAGVGGGAKIARILAILWAVCALFCEFCLHIGYSYVVSFYQKEFHPSEKELVCKERKAVSHERL